MGRDPEKTEQVVIWCNPRVKNRFDRFAIAHPDNQEALDALLDVVEENPGLTEGYFE